jgi:hypothetical protein
MSSSTTRTRFTAVIPPRFGTRKVLFRDAQLCEYANIIFDRDRGAALGYLDAVGIAYCGRYGEWGYLWTDESFKSGEMAAGRALAALR